MSLQTCWKKVLTCKKVHFLLREIVIKVALCNIFKTNSLSSWEHMTIAFPRKKSNLTLDIWGQHNSPFPKAPSNSGAKKHQIFLGSVELLTFYPYCMHGIPIYWPEAIVTMSIHFNQTKGFWQIMVSLANLNILYRWRGSTNCIFLETYCIIIFYKNMVLYTKILHVICHF